MRAHLLVGEGEDVGDRFVHPDNSSRHGRSRASTTRRKRSAGRRFEANRLHRSELGHVDRVVQPVLDVAVERWHEAVPQPALGEDQEAKPVDLVHHLHDAGEERLGGAVGIVAAPGEEQVFELIESDHHRGS